MQPTVTQINFNSAALLDGVNDGMRTGSGFYSHQVFIVVKPNLSITSVSPCSAPLGSTAYTTT